MDAVSEIARVRALSDAELLLGMNALLIRSRRAVADVVAHLGEVEERRLHLLGGYGSMFAYCVSKLKMSEDEAYRRLEVARLARRFPRLLERLAAGEISLSVAALLRRHLTEENHEALLSAVSSASMQQARETLAAWFPQPDVLPGFRKLPAPSRSPLASQGQPVAGMVSTSAVVPRAEAVPERGRAEPIAAAATGASSSGKAAQPPRSPRPPSDMAAQPCIPSHEEERRAAERQPRRALEPLAPGRYRLQLTAGAELKRKLELARDLLRHAVPSGDLSAILERAIDLLLEKTMQRRFAVTSRPKATKPSSKQKVTRHIPNDVRRTVVCRDGARCTWQSPDGVRCGSRAWLEHDHAVPYGQGGTHQVNNIRLFCRAHNRLVAEQAYGRDTIDRSVARRRAERRRTRDPAAPVDDAREMASIR
jgi:hypothetical protein